MKIKIIDILGSPNISRIVEKLKELEIEPLFDDDVISFNGRHINIAVFEQLKSRDGKSPQVIALRKAITIKQLEKIQESDAVLVLNKINTPISEDMQFEITSAWHIKKPIYLLETIPTNDPWFEMSTVVNAFNLNGDINKIKDHMELLKKIKEAVTFDKKEDTKKCPEGSRRLKLQTK